MSAKVVYLDNNATTRVAPEVVEEMNPFLTEFYGNPSSMHSFGGNVAHEITRARERVAALFNCSPDEIVFTASGSEGDNHAIRGTLEAYPDKKHIITTRVEHPAVLNTCQYYARKGYHLTMLPVDRKGRLNPQDLRDAITDETAVVSIMYANNEIGNVYPVRELAHICKEKGVVFHTDAVQVAGKLSLDTHDIAADLISISGHKLHAPKGIGALYIRRGTRVRPLVIGGHQENGRRAGTENVPYIVALGRAAELAMKNIAAETRSVAVLRDKLESGLLAKIKNSEVNGDTENRLPNTSNISFEFVEGEAILLLLNERGICASSGSACTSGSLEPSHVLRAMGVPFTRVHGSVRFSLSRYTTEDEIDFTIQAVPPIIARLMSISPYSDTRPPITA
ncbi:MAG: cysteine desulfurase NifS [Candidatus Brocadiia bacterium]